jgi:uncharacterized protein YjbI with pentapeptide repeats
VNKRPFCSTIYLHMFHFSYYNITSSFDFITNSASLYPLLHLAMDVLNIATLSNCSLTSQNLHKATLVNCTLRNAELHNSTITGSTFHSCRLHDCTIHTSIFHKSSIFGAKYMLKCQFNGTDIRASLPELQKLPVEVREMIFKETLEGCWNGKAPSLLVALRGHPGRGILSD